MSTRQRAVRVAQHIVFEGLLEALRASLVEYLSNKTPEMVYDAIKADAELWPEAPLKLQERGRRWVNQVRRFKDKITPQLILDWLKEDRMDIASLIINMGPEGKTWFVRQVNTFKEQLWPPEGVPARQSLGLTPIDKTIDDLTPPTEELPEERGESEPKIRNV